MPTKTEILFNLNLQLSAIDDKILYLVSILEQLANDPCTVEITFNMHNEKQHQLNEAVKEKQELLYKESDQYMVDRVMGYNRSLPSNQPACKNSIIFNSTEPTAIRILNALLDEHKQQRQKLVYMIEELLIPVMKIELHPVQEDPVFLLNQSR